MAEESFPPYYEVVGLTHESVEATLAACLKYRRTPRPEMSLSWLRNSGYDILTGQLSFSSLENTIEKKLPPNAWASVKLATQSLLAFSKEKAWLGERLPNFDLEVGRGVAIPIRAAGRFHSKKGRWVVGLQPRLDGGPDLVWQMQTWHAFLSEAYCLDPLSLAEPLVLDVSRDETTRKRGFNAIDVARLPLITRHELHQRMNRFIDCYLRAIELVPVRPRRERRERPQEHPPTIPGLEP